MSDAAVTMRIYSEISRCVTLFIEAQTAAPKTSQPHQSREKLGTQYFIELVQVQSIGLMFCEKMMLSMYCPLREWMYHRVRHENIVRLLGAGKDPERFLIIARLDGGTLGQRCDHGSRLRDRRGRFKGQQPFSHMEVCMYARACIQSSILRTSFCVCANSYGSGQ